MVIEITGIILHTEYEGCGILLYQLIIFIHSDESKDYPTDATPIIKSYICCQ